MKITKTRLILGFIFFCVIFSIAHPKREVVVATTEVSTPLPEPVVTATPKVKVKKSEPLKKQNLEEEEGEEETTKISTPIIQGLRWHDEWCVGDKYWRKNGASIAQQTGCQYILVSSLKPDSIVVATPVDSENVADQMIKKGFKKVTWLDDSFSPLSSRGNACIVYKDNSVTCHKND